MKLKITVDGKQYEVDVEVAEPEAPVGTAFTRPAAHTAPRQTSSEPSASAQTESVADEAKVVRSPLAGVVAEVEVVVGQEVAADQELLVLEAMKMFTSITSPRVGKVKAVSVAIADPVKQGQVLVEFE